MSLRDRLRMGRHGGDEGDRAGPDRTGTGDEGAEGPAAPAASSPPLPAPTGGHTDVTDFDPHTDGDYHCAERGLYLRFARPIVTESSEAGTAGMEPARGQFTASGRFTVQRRFERPVVYTVLEVRSRFPVHAQSFLVRRTDTADASTAELVFDFEPDSP